MRLDLSKHSGGDHNNFLRFAIGHVRLSNVLLGQGMVNGSAYAW